MENNLGQLESATSLLRQAFDLVKARAKVLYGIYAITYLAGIILLLIVGGSALGGVFLGGDTGLFTGGAISIVAFFAFLIVALWVQIALMQAIINNLTFSQAFSANDKIRPFLSTSILAGLIIMLGYVLLIVPGIIFTIWYSFAGLIVLTEGLTGMDALRQSKRYVQGRWGAVAWRIFFVTLMIWIVSFLVQIALGFWLPDAAGIGSTVVTFLAAPVITAYQYILYQNLRVTMLPEALMPNITLPPAPTPGQ